MKTLFISISSAALTTLPKVKKFFTNLDFEPLLPLKGKYVRLERKGSFQKACSIPGWTVVKREESRTGKVAHLTCDSAPEKKILVVYSLGYKTTTVYIDRKSFDDPTGADIDVYKLTKHHPAWQYAMENIDIRFTSQGTKPSLAQRKAAYKEGIDLYIRDFDKTIQGVRREIMHRTKHNITYPSSKD